MLLGIGGTMRLAQGVTARDQRHGLFIVHRHAPEGAANLLRGQHRIRHAANTLGVDIDQAHLRRGERAFEPGFGVVTLVSQPLAFRAPEHIRLRLPHIDATTGKAKGLEARLLESHVAREDHQVGPRNLGAVLLLQRPQQAPRLVEVGIVRPAVQRRETNRAIRRTTATVRHAIGARAVPGQTNEETAIGAVISRPPILRGRQQRRQVLLERRHVELGVLLGIVERRPHRVARRRVLVQHAQVELIRPPIGVGHHARRRLAIAGVHWRGRVGHGALSVGARAGHLGLGGGVLGRVAGASPGRERQKPNRMQITVHAFSPR